MKKITTTAAQLKKALGQVKNQIVQAMLAAAQDIDVLDAKKLDKSGGTLTGNLTGKYITGTWLQTTASGHLNSAATKVPVLDASGWLYYRTPAELLGDMGGAPKPLKGSITIPTTGWGSDSTATYPKYYDITADNVTEKDYASVDIVPASLSTAAACGLCPACETLAGKIRLRAVEVPAASMTANYWIEKGD